VLQEFLGGLDLDEETQERARINPLRVLDDKREQVQAQLEQVPLMMSHLCENCSEHYARVRAYLETSGVIWQENPRMVRGLDYYTRTTFEFVHHGLGAQSGIGGGGRYDGLMSELGGSDLSGIGYGLGVDRTLLACEAEGLTPFRSSIIDLYIIPIGHEAQLPAFSLMSKLRASGLSCDMSFDARSMKSAMKNADRSGAPYVALLGDDEVAAGLVTLKSMATGDQERIALDAESIATKVRAATTDVK